MLALGRIPARKARSDWPHRPGGAEGGGESRDGGAGGHVFWSACGGVGGRDVEQVVVEDGAPGALPVGPEGVLRVAALHVLVDEFGGGRVAREAELRITL